MGDVFVAHDPQFDSRVALKVLKKERAGDEEIFQRFLNEVRNTHREAYKPRRFAHPNIVTVYDVGFDHGTTFIVMELLKGATLLDVMRDPFRDNECLTSETKFKIITQMAKGVDYMHKMDVIHKNLEPRNIFITENMHVKIMGLIDVYREERMMYSHWASPEAFQGKGFVDHRADLFHLGMIFYELFSGRYPFSPSSSGSDRMLKIINETPSSIKELDPEYQFLERVIMRLLEKKPDNRYQLAQDLLNDLTGNKADRQQGTWYRHLPR